MFSELVFFLVISAVFTLLIIPYLRNKKIYESLPDDIEEQSQVKAFDFNGHTLYMSESDLEAFKALSNKQKQEMHLKQKQLIRQGILIKVTDDFGRDGLITQREAIRTGVRVLYRDPITNKEKIVTPEEFEIIKTKTT